MTSQNDENLPASSSNVISLEADSPRPSQIDEVVVPGKRKRYSKAWKHFKLVYVDGVPYGQCKYCKSQYKNAKNCGTTSMWDHLRKCAKKPRGEGDIDGDDEGHYFDQDVSRKQLAHAIILHEYPLSIVDHVGFRNFVASLQPMFKMVSRNTINNDILNFLTI